jgi:hypothetical protein
MTEGDSGEHRDTSRSPASPNEARSLSYGNIYTPHAGSMIIHVQRESGLQSRMIVLGPRRVRLLRFLTSRSGKIALVCGAAIMMLVLVEAARVPALMRRLARMEHTAARLDSLERSLGQLQRRYDQVRVMMGADSNSALESARLFPRALTPMTATAPRLGTQVSPDVGVVPPGAAPGGREGDAPSAGSEVTGIAPATAVADQGQGEAVPRPIRARRRHALTAAPDTAAPADSTATPDTGAVPSSQAEPQ